MARRARDSPMWVPDDDPRAKVCMSCSKTYAAKKKTGRSGKHHCRCCGWAVCDDCLADEEMELDRWVTKRGPLVQIRPDQEPQPQKGRMELMAYDLHDDGTATFRRTLVNYYPQDGPDGLCCDVKGNIYVAERDTSKPGIGIYSPEGKQLDFIPTELPTNVGFGRGEDASVLYITAGSSLFRIRLSIDGYHLPSK